MLIEASKLQCERIFDLKKIAMIWKIGIYMILVALPLSIFTSEEDMKSSHDAISTFVEVNATEEETIKTDGAILGSIIAPNAEIEIKGTDGEQTIVGTTDENGEFFMTGFDAGTYTICVQAVQGEEVITHTFEDVEINIGEVTALGTVTIE